jgi:hypothetical protein
LKALIHNGVASVLAQRQRWKVRVPATNEGKNVLRGNLRADYWIDGETFLRVTDDSGYKE